MPRHRPRDVQLLPPRHWRRGPFLQALAAAFVLHRDPPASETRTYYDTAHFQLGLHGLALSHAGTRLSLYAGDAAMPLAETACRTAPTGAAETGILRPRLTDLIEDLPLVLICRVRTRREAVRLLDRRGKTTAWLIVEEQRPASRGTGPAVWRRVWIRPLTGYRKTARQAAEWCAKQGLTPAADGFPHALLALAPRKPGKYSAKLPMGMASDMPADRAVRRLLRLLLAMLRYNEDGIRRTNEAVYVHDFRVAIRRARVLVGQTRDVFPAADVQRFRKTLARLGRMTGDLRDLDVFILAEAAAATHREAAEPAMQPVSAFLREQRREHARRLATVFEGVWYRTALEEWQAFAAPARRPMSATPCIGGVISACVADHCRALAEVSADRLAQADDKQLHALRIRCKKLRYLIDCFVEGFPGRPVKTTLQRLKGVQRTLGGLQDVSVQQGWLDRFQASAPELAGSGHAVVRALAEVRDRQAVRKQTLRENLPDEFAALTASLRTWRTPADRGPTELRAPSASNGPHETVSRPDPPIRVHVA